MIDKKIPGTTMGLPDELYQRALEDEKWKKSRREDVNGLFVSLKKELAKWWGMREGKYYCVACNTHIVAKEHPLFCLHCGTGNDGTIYDLARGPMLKCQKLDPINEVNGLIAATQRYSQRSRTKKHY